VSKEFEEMVNRLVALATVLAAIPAWGADVGPELKPFQGHWQVAELVEDGKVIPKEAIREWLPSGGRAEIIENAIVFKSPQSDRSYAKVFTIDATKYPRGIEISTPEGIDTAGIYRFDDGKLVVCLADPREAERPKDFSAEAGSKRMLMVLERTDSNAPSTTNAESASPTGGGTAGTILTDEQVAKMLAGTWKLNDSAGSLYVTFEPDGKFSTVREYQELRLFHKSFVQTPISTGTWGVKNGNLTAEALQSVRPERVDRKLAFAVRSISKQDMIFVDPLGRVVSAVKVK
jgi:uncharacterized protein (TIGR03067 family)